MHQDEYADEFVQSTSTKYKDWEDANKRLVKQQLPKNGAVYLRQAKNMLPLLEGVAEANPIFKGVLFSFKAVITFENERAENDVRVSSMLLAKTNMMWTILEAARLSETMEEYRKPALRKILERAQSDIEQSGNILDTYKKESRLVRCIKALDWKEQITEITSSFMERRDELQNFFAIRTAGAVDDLREKLDILIKQVFIPSEVWEKRLQAKLAEYGPIEHWIDNKDKVHELLKTSQDPLAQQLFSNKNDEKGSTETHYKSFVVNLKNQLETSLEGLLQRNMELFGRKLEFHRTEVLEAVRKSGDSVVRRLEGPYDRLNDPELKRLWKEMGWIFCVENRLFTVALYEYYLDHFNSKFKMPPPGSEEEPQELSTEELSSRQGDMWTLEYLSASSINDAVDSDRSGLIRISEVNVFTSQVPEGWSLPQWCAYVAIGWRYEQTIYQTRLQVLLQKLVEAQAKVTPSNLLYLQQYTRLFGLPFDLSRQHDGGEFSHLPESFKHQIRSKIAEQDRKMRQLWKDFKYTFGDICTVTTVYKEKPVDSYILQLCMIFLEHVLDVAAICQDQTVDLRDWIVIDEAYSGLVSLAKTHLEGFQEGLGYGNESAFSLETLKDRHGGLWRAYLEDVEWTPAEALARSLRGDFDLEEFIGLEQATDTSGVLLHQTWEEYLEDQGLSPDDVDVAPCAWGEGSSNIVQSYPPRVQAELPGPHMDQVCDLCKVYPIPGFAYRCVACSVFDLCEHCYGSDLPLDSSSIADHTASHPVIKEVLSTSRFHRQWLRCLAALVLERFLDLNRYALHVEGVSVQSCKHCCHEVTHDIYICLDSQCIVQDIWACASCHETMMEPENGDDSCRLHPTLILNVEALDLRLDTEEEEHHGFLSHALPSEEQKLMDKVEVIEAKVGGLEVRLAGIEQRLQVVMNLLEDRLE